MSKAIGYVPPPFVPPPDSLYYIIALATGVHGGEGGREGVQIGCVCLRCRSRWNITRFLRSSRTPRA
jgi:hypothetical protein